MKTLLTNGCSWTWGGGIDNYMSDEDRIKNVWPHHLMNLLECDNNVNLSMGCGSNQRIVRTTLDWILKQDRETLDNTIAVIQWSEPSRYEYYSKSTVPEQHNNWDWENHDNDWALIKAGCCIYPPGDRNHVIHKEEFHQSQLRYNTYSDIEGLYSFITQFTALATIFEKYNIEYYYWNALGVPVKYFPDSMKDYAFGFNWININHNDWYYDRVSKEDNHPNEHGHKRIAHYIFKEIQSLNNGLL
jgi:hypothetical protein